MCVRERDRARERTACEVKTNDDGQHDCRHAHRNPQVPCERVEERPPLFHCGRALRQNGYRPGIVRDSPLDSKPGSILRDGRPRHEDITVTVFRHQMFFQRGSSLDTHATKKIRRRARGVVCDALRRLGRLGRLDPTDLGGDVSKQVYRETTETRPGERARRVARVCV